MDFKSYTKFTLWANLIGSMVAVLMAFAGMGVWAIVGQRLAVPVVRALLLWGKSSWRPSGRLSMAPLRSMLGYSSRLLASDLANSIYANVSQLFIGKMSQSDLGHYEQARNFKDMPVSAIISTIQGVTFPAM